MRDEESHEKFNFVCGFYLPYPVIVQFEFAIEVPLVVRYISYTLLVIKNPSVLWFQKKVSSLWGNVWM